MFDILAAVGNGVRQRLVWATEFANFILSALAGIEDNVDAVTRVNG